MKKELENITDYTVVENADGTYTVTLPKTTETEKIGEGSVMILPANEVYISGIALKATTVTALIGGGADTDEYGIATQANIGAGGVIDVGYEKKFEFNIGSNDEGKGKIDFEIPEILCVVNVDVGVNGVSVNELKLAVTENQMDPYIFHIALNQHRDLNIKMEHGEAFSIFIMVLIPLR